jgi:hypothetical protein
MMNTRLFIYIILIFSLVSCQEEFLNREPLSEPSTEGFWTSAENAEKWVNSAYNSLPDGNFYRQNWSDDALDRTKPWSMGGDISDGTFDPANGNVANEWSYSTIRHCLEFYENIDKVPDISQERKDELSGQVRFILAFEYLELITLFRDVPLVTKPVSIKESDLQKSPKSEVLSYIIDQLDQAIEELPEAWPESDNGRATKGAALALKARALLYNERWSDAATAAKRVMDLDIYELHPDFGELFIKAMDNKAKGIILSYQYTELVREHNIYRKFGIIENGGWALTLPTASLANAFRDSMGVPIEESSIYDPDNPTENREPRFYETLILPYQTFAGYYFDPEAGRNPAFSLTNLHFRKYINDKQPGDINSHVNWKILRYAEVLLTYAEAKNEASGPDASIYDALDKVRNRGGIPDVDRNKYDTKEKLRELIRRERRVELAGEGLRYFDIIRWRIAEDVLNKQVRSFEIPGKLTADVIDTWTFIPNKHYVWPIPQYAIDRSKKLEQHSEWK